jgi:hypothetical protein
MKKFAILIQFINTGCPKIKVQDGQASLYKLLSFNIKVWQIVQSKYFKHNKPTYQNFSMCEQVTALTNNKIIHFDHWSLSVTWLYIWANIFILQCNISSWCTCRSANSNPLIFTYIRMLLQTNLYRCPNTHQINIMIAIYNSKRNISITMCS